MEHESDGDTICGWCTWNNLQRIGKGTGIFENKMKSRDPPDCSIIKISQNAKSPRDLRRLGVTQSPEENI